MAHPIYRVCCCERVAPYVLKVGFDDGTQQVIDFQPGADFDPETLHGWPGYVGEFAERARHWKTSGAVA